jgi:hypothetical protein
LTSPKWSEGFVRAVKDATGAKRFTHVTAVAKLVGSRQTWEGLPALSRGAWRQPGHNHHIP